jgi:hypothetical protein
MRERHNERHISPWLDWLHAACKAIAQMQEPSPAVGLHVLRRSSVALTWIVSSCACTTLHGVEVQGCMAVLTPHPLKLPHILLFSGLPQLRLMLLLLQYLNFPMLLLLVVLLVLLLVVARLSCSRLAWTCVTRDTSLVDHQAASAAAPDSTAQHSTPHHSTQASQPIQPCFLLDYSAKDTQSCHTHLDHCLC